MKFFSTRGGVAPQGIRQALEAGLAPDGGLFVPDEFPAFNLSDFDQCQTHAEVATRLLRPFFAEDEDLAPELSRICDETFNFPIPLVPVPARSGDFILELFHGPTSAFKDVGARFLAGCMEVIAASEPTRAKRTVIVATSGDTGGAVAGAFFGKTNIDVMILYPEGRISARQEKQLCAWGGNVRAFAVQGTFDDCQRIVKEALLDKQLKDRIWLSANSINLGRILPQMVYYAHAAILFARRKNLSGKESLPGFIIPSGNLGNSLACAWAKKMGLPIGTIHLAFNANRGVVDYLAHGTPSTATTLATLANAMDVSKPSNLERFNHLYPKVENLKREISASTVSDDEIRKEIETSEVEWGEILCPHTAVAAVARKDHLAHSSTSEWIVVATAHPAKFESIVEPLIKKHVPIPELLAQILTQPSQVELIGPNYKDLKIFL